MLSILLALTLFCAPEIETPVVEERNGGIYVEYPDGRIDAYRIEKLSENPPSVFLTDEAP